MKKLCCILTIVCLGFVGISFAFERITKDNFIPIGDGINVEVYTFIVDALQKSASFSLESIEKLRAEELQNTNNKDWKSHMAVAYEGELPGLLRLLCQAHSKCYDITLYQKDGVAVATTGIRGNNVFKERSLNFKIGILDSDTKKPREYTYTLTNKKKYVEILNPIYMDQEKKVGYIDSKKKKPEDLLIGYGSWIIEIRQ